MAQNAEIDRVALGKKIRKIRKDKKMTITELADGICSIGTMSNIENGLTRVSDDNLRKIAEKLSVSTAVLTRSAKNLNNVSPILQGLENLILMNLYDIACIWQVKNALNGNQKCTTCQRPLLL